MIDAHDKTLAAQLCRDEGAVLHAYQDSEGYWTIGVGRVIDKRRGGGISEDEAVFLLANDIDRALMDAMTFPWFVELSEPRQRVVVNMLFNLGLTRFKTFRRFLSAMALHDYLTAASEMADSKWYRQVGARAERLVHTMKTNEEIL